VALPREAPPGEALPPGVALSATGRGAICNRAWRSLQPGVAPSGVVPSLPGVVPSLSGVVPPGVAPSGVVPSGVVPPGVAQPGVGRSLAGSLSAEDGLQAWPLAP
jgi:hypothetical protein